MLIKLHCIAAVYDALLRGRKVSLLGTSQSWSLRRGVLVDEQGEEVWFSFANVEKGVYAEDDDCVTDIERKLTDFAKTYLAESGSYPEKLFLRADEWFEAVRVLREPTFTVEGQTIQLERGDW